MTEGGEIFLKSVSSLYITAPIQYTELYEYFTMLKTVQALFNYVFTTYHTIMFFE